MSNLKQFIGAEQPRGPRGEWTGEEAVFTRFLQGLDSGGPGEREGFEAVWLALRRVLVGELKRRSLWTLSPAYVGIYGSASWADEEAVEELVADGFAFIFVERLRSLKAHLRLKPNVEGLIVRSARNFLQEAQKRHDPVGFRVFTVLRGAVRSAVAAGALHVVEGSSAVRRDTVLAFHAGAAARPGELAAEARSWNVDLLPDLITARGWEVRPLMARVEKLLLRLPAQGFPVFRFQDLVDPLRLDVRMRWRALWTSAQGEELPQPGEDDRLVMARIAVPARSLEERESFRSLLNCLEEGIENLAQRAQSKEYLRRLQMFLRCYAADAMPAPAGEELPSRRRLADLLGIPRDRLPDLFTTLQKLAEVCRQGAGKALP